jgi:cytochrome c peroxidase
MFFDGRATGWTLGDPLAEQAEAPFLNPLEQNNPRSEDVIQKVKFSDYSDLFKEVHRLNP